MRKIDLICLLSVLSCNVYAGLQSLDSDELAEVRGQAGADLSWNLQLNHTPNGEFDTTLCSDLRFCRIGMSLNKRYLSEVSPGQWRADDVSGHKLWLVMKGVQGTVNLQKFGLDGVDLSYRNKSDAVVTKPAIQLSFTDKKPILIRNFGFQSLSIEKDSLANEATGNIPGYLVPTTAGSGTYNYNANTFDGQHPTNPNIGRETGFTGLMMHGNLALSGQVKIFGCDSSHPRC